MNFSDEYASHSQHLDFRIATMIPNVMTDCSCMYVRSMPVKPFLYVKFDVLMETLEMIMFLARMCTCKQQRIMSII